MRAKQFTRKVFEAIGDSDVANAVVAEVIKLIGEGHTEVSPDVITTKVSAALGRPFMLKDLVAANNSSPELQHHIDSINPSKIKFSTDILTVKNQDPVKEKERAEAGVANMAARAAGRPRLGEAADQGISKSAETKFHKKLDTLVHDTFGKRKDEVEEGIPADGQHRIKSSKQFVRAAQVLGATVKDHGDELTAHDKKGNIIGEYSRDEMIGWIYAPSTDSSALKEGWGRGTDRVTIPDDSTLYWNGNGPLQQEYDALYNELVPSMGKADTIEGEVLRAASKIVYRHYNDGDDFNQASFEQLVPYIGAVTSYDDLAHKATEFAIKANGNYTPNPNWDSLDVMEYGPEEDDYDDYEEDDSDWYDEEDEEEDEDDEVDEAVNWPKEVPSDASQERNDDEENDPHPYTPVSEEWQDGADLISQWNIPQQEWAQFETAVEDVLAATESDEAWEKFWQVIKDDLQYLDRPLRDAFEHSLGSMNADEVTEAVLNGLRRGYESAGTEPRPALGLLTDIIEDGVRKLGMNEGWKSALATGAMGAALAFGGSGAAQAGQSPEQAPQKASAPATQQAQAQNPYHNDLGVLVGVAQSKGGMQVLGKILSADQIQQVKAAYAKAKADPNLAKSAQFKQGQQLGFELGNSYADSSSQQMTDLNKRGPSYAGILSPMVVKPGEARSAEDITKVNQANAGKLKQAVTAAYGNMMAGGLQESDKEEFKSTYKKYYEKVKQQKEQTNEGWESGPEERSSRERDPDAEYDDMRQQKADAEAQAQQARRPQTKVYTLTGRGPNYEPNYKFPGEYASQDEAAAARAKLMADPKTPNPRDIGISSHTKFLDESRETPLRDREDYQAKKKALQDIQMDPHTSKDPELSAEVLRRLAGLEKQRSELK